MMTARIGLDVGDAECAERNHDRQRGLGAIRGRRNRIEPEHGDAGERSDLLPVLLVRGQRTAENPIEKRHGCQVWSSKGDIDLNRGVAHLLEEAVQRRSLHQDFPPRAGRLTEDDVRDALALGEGNQPIRRTVGFHSHHGRAERLGELDVVFERRARRVRTAALRGRVDVHRVPTRAQPRRDPRAGPDHAWSRFAGTHADHDAFGNQRGLEALALPQ